MLRQIVDEKIPPMVEPTTKAPTPLSACLLDFILQPLEFATNSVNTNHRCVYSSNFFLSCILTNLILLPH